MASAQTGKWRNSPLAYVVAEVVISPNYSLGQAVPAIQQGLRERFPRTNEGTEVPIGLIVPGSMPATSPERIWQLLTADGSRGVYLGTRSISFHATSYEDFPEFATWLEFVLRAIARTNLQPHVERIGLRYIDYIIPSEGTTPSDYVVPEIRGVSPAGAGSAQSAMWAGAFPIEGCTVNARVAAPAPQGMYLPPNFAPLPLAKPATIEAAEKLAQASKPLGFIDTDCTCEINKPFEPSDLIAAFNRMHEHVSMTFTAVMSELAGREWK